MYACRVVHVAVCRQVRLSVRVRHHALVRTTVLVGTNSDTVLSSRVLHFRKGTIPAPIITAEKHTDLLCNYVSLTTHSHKH